MIVTLSEELHFRRAAAKLYMSQPALSAAVKTLEQSLGVKLFVRGNRNVELTVAGRVFVEEARGLITQSERLVTFVRGFQDEPGRHLRVGYSPAIDVEWFCSTVAKAQGKLNLAIQVTGTEAAALPALLVRNELDAAAMWGDIQKNPEPLRIRSNGAISQARKTIGRSSKRLIASGCDQALRVLNLHKTQLLQRRIVTNKRLLTSLGLLALTAGSSSCLFGQQGEPFDPPPVTQSLRRPLPMLQARLFN